MFTDTKYYVSWKQYGHQFADGPAGWFDCRTDSYSEQHLAIEDAICSIDYGYPASENTVKDLVMNECYESDCPDLGKAFLERVSSKKKREEEKRQRDRKHWEEQERKELERLKEKYD